MIVMEKKILVTGGTGQVGRHLQELIPNATFLSSKDCNLLNEHEVAEALRNEQPHTVVHLAARVGGIIDNVNHASEYFYDNIMMNTILVDQCRRRGVQRFIGMLSTCAYPDRLHDEMYPMKEECMHMGPPTPTNFSYGYAKRCMAVHIDSINKQYGTRYQYIIPPNLYGPYDKFGERSHYIGALLNKLLIAQKTESSTINLMGDGTPIRQFIHAEDLARIIHRCIEEDITVSFNAAPMTTHTIREIAETALKACDMEHVDISWSGELSGQHRKDASGEKLKELMPDFEFVSLEEGIKKTWEYINNNGMTR